MWIHNDCMGISDLHELLLCVFEGAISLLLCNHIANIVDFLGPSSILVKLQIRIEWTNVNNKLIFKLLIPKLKTKALCIVLCAELRFRSRIGCVHPVSRQLRVNGASF